MIFQEIYRNSFCLTINLELDEEILKIFSCVHLSLDPNTNKEMNFKNINDFLKFYKDNLDLINYEIQTKNITFYFNKRKYYELYNIKEDKKGIDFDFPYIITLNIIYGKYAEKRSKLQYKATGISYNNILNIEPLSTNSDENFTQINFGNGAFEIIEKNM